MDCFSKLNIGSGKDFRDDFLNLDIDAGWSPDVVFDLNVCFPYGKKFNTRRFGEIVVEKDSFDLIAAYDVLEHLRNLTVAMKSCLDLLRVGGVLRFVVPYDLSFGAWQDPFHVRTFNERSFLYFTDWFWYLGWERFRFRLEELEYVLSGLGKGLVDEGLEEDDIARIPRAVEFLQGSLKKVVLSDEDLVRLNGYKKPKKECRGTV